MSFELSAFIIVKNQAQRISATILSLQALAREIIVVDNGNCAQASKIASSLGCKVIYHFQHSDLSQKAFAENLCAYDWVINIDSDEVLSQDLQHEISYIFTTGLHEKYKGYWIDLPIMMLCDAKPRLWSPKHRRLRLYNKKYASFSFAKDVNADGAILNAGFDPKSHLSRMLAPAYNYSLSSISQLVRKLNFYTDQQTLDLIHAERGFSPIRVCFEFFFSLIKYYFLRRYFVFGFRGLIYSMIFAFARFLRCAKVYDIVNSVDTKSKI